MDADVGHGAAGSTPAGIHLPGVAHVEGLREVDLPEAALVVFEHDLADLADFALGDEFAGEFDHRHAGIGEGDAQDAALAASEASELLGLRHGHGERFLAHHVEPRLEGGLGDFIVRVVRRADGEEVDVVLFGRQQRGPVGMDVFGGKTELAGRLGVLLRIARERARDEIRQIVHADRHAVHRSDKGALGTTHHCISETLHHRNIPFLVFGEVYHTRLLRDGPSHVCRSAHDFDRILALAH